MARRASIRASTGTRGSPSWASSRSSSGCGDADLVRGEERQIVGQREPGQHDPGGDVVPHVDLVQDVEAGEPAPALRGDGALRLGRGTASVLSVAGSGSLSRRSTAASRPIPPTREASSGANTGGPASML